MTADAHSLSWLAKTVVAEMFSRYMRQINQACCSFSELPGKC